MMLHHPNNLSPSTINPPCITSITITLSFGGSSSQVLRYRTHGWRVMSSSPVPLRTRGRGRRCSLNLSRAQTSSRCRFATPVVQTIYFAQKQEGESDTKGEVLMATPTDTSISTSCYVSVSYIRGSIEVRIAYRPGQQLNDLRNATSLRITLLCGKEQNLAEK
ncbi:hypothetical protein TNCV_3960751 [Trichonephila clavipes]|nr:hypothetical protein TNCV_3960751 [Trichonephila clavipes]